MAKRPGLTRWDAVWAAGCVGLFLLFAAVARTPYFAVFRLLFVGALLTLGISDWRTKGHGWLPTLSWTVPLGVLWIAGQWFILRPIALAVLVFWLGGTFLVVMMASERAGAWWYKVVLRRPYKT